MSPRDLPCAVCGQLMYRSSTSAPEGQAKCNPCRRANPAPKKSWVSTKQCTVGHCVRPVLSRDLCSSHYSMWHRKQRRHTITCRWCGEEAKVGRPQAQYCGTLCANRARQAIMVVAAAAANRAAGLERRRSRNTIVPYVGRTYRRKPTPNKNPIKTSARRFKSGQCRVCQTWFISLNTDTTCSPECFNIKLREERRIGRDRRRARKKAAYVADVYRKQVFERDGYRCHLCRKKTRPDKPVPHPRSPTIDHVIPLAAGGTHEPLNCRTACYRCNCIKSDGGGGEQLLLIA